MTGCAWCLHTEYTHIVHLEKSRGWIGGLRRVFGRVPLLQPNVFLPQWQVEGIATFEESVVTGKGRVPAGDFRMILNRAAVQGRFAPLDRAGGGVIDWPSGNGPYVYGAYFHQYLAERYGSVSLERLAEATAGTLPFFGSRAFRTVFGRSLGALWSDFESDTDGRIRSSGIADAFDATRLTRHGFSVTAPAFSADGRIFYSVVNPHDFPALMELRPGTTVPRRVASRYLGERIRCRRRPSGVQPAGGGPAYRSAIRSLRRSDRRWCTRRLTRDAARDGCGCRARWPHHRLHRAADRPPDSCHFRHAATGAIAGAGAIRLRGLDRILVAAVVA